MSIITALSFMFTPLFIPSAEGLSLTFAIDKEQESHIQNYIEINTTNLKLQMADSYTLHCSVSFIPDSYIIWNRVSITCWMLLDQNALPILFSP